MNGLRRWYARLLRRYPADFQAEFGEEMTAVFTQTMMEAVERGRWAVTATLEQGML